MNPPPQHFRFTHAQRLHGSREFSAVFDARARKIVGPLVVHGKPNDVGHPRLGLSVPRRVGNAVARNRVKRLLREAFRLSQHAFAHGYDIVVAVRPHKPATLADYQRMLLTAMGNLHGEWQRRGRKDGRGTKGLRD